MKLFYFTPSVLLFRKRRCLWELIHWDQSTDTFTRGQWLTRKSIWVKGSSASEDGTMFKYHYEDQTGAYVVTSKVPNFTAVEFHDAQCGRWFVETFENRRAGPSAPPEGYTLVDGSVFRNGELLIDFSQDVFSLVNPV
jgi:hypothetical protein